ncbi:MAG TPA: hypothetical protein PKV93_14880 [Fervidobacterium sp.]|nr:hypothetical protein [Fervidobacterium sp.]
MGAFIGDYKDAVKYYDKERGENRIKVYVNDELQGTYYTAIVVGIPASDEVIDDDGLEMHILTLGTFGIDIYLAAQQLFNETINRKIEQCIIDASNNFAKEYGENPDPLLSQGALFPTTMQKQIISKADEP